MKRVPISSLLPGMKVGHPIYNSRGETLIRYSILTNYESDIGKISALIALQHHERHNGEGYPNGLCGDDIHDFSQIVGMADIYDAITADRVYRKAHPPGEAYEMLAGSGNFFFNYELVQSFLYNIAAYPTGTLVRLNSNEIAVVEETPKGFSLYPILKIKCRNVSQKTITNKASFQFNKIKPGIRRMMVTIQKPKLLIQQ